MNDLSVSEEFPKLKFSELSHLSQNDVPLYISHAEAILICKRSLELGDVNGIDVQKIWFNKLLKAYEIKKFTAENWIEILSFMDNVYKQLIECTVVESKILDDINIWLVDCYNLMKWFRPLAMDFSISCNCIIIGYALEIVIGAMKFCKKWNGENDLNNHVQSFLNIHNIMLRTLNENVKNWNLSSTAEHSYLTEVIGSLCIVGENGTVVNIKTIIETWKTIAKLTTVCVKCANLEQNNDSNGKRLWVQRPMVFLVKEIARNMTTIYKEDTLKQKIEQIDKFLRVTNFYLKLLTRLSHDFQHLEFPIIDEFWETYLLSKFVPQHLKGTEVVSLLDKYVFEGLKNIFSIVYKNNAISKLLCTCTCMDNARSLIVRDYLTAVIKEKDTIFISKYISNFTELFNVIWTDETNFIESNKYNDIIELYAALLIICTHDDRHRLLQGVLLHEKLPIAQAFCDVLTVASSSSHMQPTDLLKLFYHLRHCNSKFSLFTINSKKLLIARLLRHCYELCITNGAIEKHKLWNQYAETQLTLQNSSFYLSLGLSKDFLSESGIQYFQMKLNDDILELIEDTKNGACDTAKYYRLLVCVNLFATAKLEIQPKKLLFEKLFALVRKITDLDLTLAKNFAKFISAFLNLASRNIFAIEGTVCTTILQNILKRHGIYLNIAPVATIKFLHTCHKSYQTTQVQTAVRHVHEIATKSNYQTVNIAALFFDQQLQQHQKLQPTLATFVEHLDLYKSINYFHKKHICSDTQHIKRPRLSLIYEKTDFKIVLNNLLENSEKLKNSKFKPDEHEIVSLNSVVDNLKCVISASKT